MFTRKQFTIPAAGTNEIFNLDGVSLIVESLPVYSNPVEVPILKFQDTNNAPQPLYPQSTYTFGKEFQRVILEGTTESAGDTIFILTTPQCLQEEINVNTAGDRRATLKDSFSIVMSGTAQSLSTLQIQNAAGQLPTAMYITPTGSGCRYAFGVAPGATAGGDTAHFIAENEVQKIQGINFITAFQFIESPTGAAGELTFTMEY